MSTSLKELNAVQLEPLSATNSGKGKGKARAEVESSDEDEDSELESAPSDEDPDMEIDYEVDAIKWAKYRDSVRDRQDGFKGWHYGVMWKGFLKTGSETEEPLASFESEDGKTPLVDEFWKAVGRPIPKGRKEPRGTRLGEVIETPKSTMKNWLKGCRPKRNYNIYVRRRAKELQREKYRPDQVPDDLLTTKADSDYYWSKKRKREKLKQKKEESAKIPSRSKSASVAPSTAPSSSVPKVINNLHVAKPPAISPAASLGSPFNSDRDDVSMHLDAASDEEKKVLEQPSQSQGSSNKRKQVLSSPELDASTAAAPQGQPIKKAKNGESPPKKANLNLASMGKIAKRAASPPATAPVQTAPETTATGLSFGQLQPGIFDRAPSPAPVPASAPPTQTGIETPVAANTANPIPPSAEHIAAASQAAQPSPPPTASSVGPPTANETSTSAPAPTAPPIRPTAPRTAQLPVPRPPTPGPPVNPVSKLINSLHSARPPPVVTQPEAQSTQPRPPALRPVVAVPSPPPTSGPVPNFRPAPVTAQARPMAPASENKHMIPANRPRYAQPTRIQIVDNTVDPLAARRLAKLGVHDPHLIYNPTANSTQTLPPTQASRPRSTAFVPRNQQVPPVIQQPQPPPPYGPLPLGPPAAPRAEREAYGFPQAGPLLEQNAIYQGGTAPWQKRQQAQQATAGHLSLLSHDQPPAVPGGHVSPNQYVDPAGYTSPTVGPSGYQSPQLDHSSPSLSGVSFPVPVPSSNYLASKDPRLRGKQQTSASTAVSPAQAIASLPTPTSASPIQDQSSTQLPPIPAHSLRPVESQGGLVTFSPSLLLRLPDKLYRIMTLLRTSPHWGAYIVPAVLVSVDRSWPSKDLCPDPTAAFSTLVQFLPLDDSLRQFSGAAISSGSGLSISCCPPSPYAGDACAQWKSWLGEIALVTDYMKLVDRCRGIKSGYFESLAQDARQGGTARPETNGAIKGEVDIREVESAQLQDMAAMRMRRDVVNFTRFVYVGENGISQEAMDLFGAGIEFLLPDDFAANLEAEAA